jgi:hypothetical protein
MDAMTPPAMLAPPTPQQQMAAMPPVPPKPISHDVTIITTRKLARARVMGVPPEEFGIERAARNIKDCNYCFHEVVTKTRGQLINEGFDLDQVLGLTAFSGQSPNNVETLARDSVQEHFITSSDVDALMQLVRITEHYIRMDYEGRGNPCLYMVITGGDQADILKKGGKEVVEPVDVIPFAATTPVPITHRFFGRSMADLVMPTQRIKTALLRNGLDSQYLSTGADVELPEAASGTSTIDDLLGPKRPGRVIRTKAAGLLKWQEIPDTSASAFKAMEYMDSLLESRTGLAKQTQGLDADALQNQSATAVAQVFSASQMRVKLVARIMAEGVREIFALLHHTIRSHGQEEQTVRLRNKWVPVDPRNWKTRDDMTINVGLGSGGKAQQFAQTMAIANVQKEMLAGGKSNLVGDRELYNTASELTKIMGHKNPDQFFNDPTAKDPKTGQLLHPPAPPAPDPKLQVEQLKQQGQQQISQQKQAHDQAKAQADMLHQQIKAQADIEVAKVKADLDAKIAIINAHIAEIQAEQKMRQGAQAHHADVVSKVVDMAAMAHAHDTKMEHAQATHEAKLEQMRQKPEPSNAK